MRDQNDGLFMAENQPTLNSWFSWRNWYSWKFYRSPFRMVDRKNPWMSVSLRITWILIYNLVKEIKLFNLVFFRGSSSTITLATFLASTPCPHRERCWMHTCLFEGFIVLFTSVVRWMMNSCMGLCHQPSIVTPFGTSTDTSPHYSMSITVLAYLSPCRASSSTTPHYDLAQMNTIEKRLPRTHHGSVLLVIPLMVMIIPWKFVSCVLPLSFTPLSWTKLADKIELEMPIARSIVTSATLFPAWWSGGFRSPCIIVELRAWLP